MDFNRLTEKSQEAIRQAEAEEEPEDSIVDRAARFRADLARRHDWSNTLVVSHWGFILTLTGQSVANGQWLRCDPTEPAPRRLIWQA